MTQRAWEKFPGLRPWLRPRVEPPFEVEHLAVRLYTRPSWWRRLVSLSSGLVLSVVIGAMVALVLGGAAVWFVGTLTGRLK